MDAEPILALASAAAWRAWLKANHARSRGVLLRIAKGAAKAVSYPEALDALARNKRARAFFGKLDGANRYAILYRVQTAKKPETRSERIKRFVAMCARGERVHPKAG